MFEVQYNKSLLGLNSFGINAVADRFVEFDSEGDLRDYFRTEGNDNDNWYVLSGGNNILLSGDYHGTLLHPVNKDIEVVKESADLVEIRVGAGLEWDDLVEYTIAKGWYGLENLSLIPGYVGAAPIQNIGAYGIEAKDSIVSVEALMVSTGEVKTIDNASCRFGYRDSVFKHELREEAIILRVVFRLTKTFNPCLDYGDLRSHTEKIGEINAANVRKAVIAIREAKLPDPKKIGNAGSFFKNPVVDESQAEKLKTKYPDMPIYKLDGGKAKLAAGWLIDKAGWKGHRRGKAGVHDKQALVIVNRGGASGADILDLAERIQKSVFELFGVDIEMEVNVL